MSLDANRRALQGYLVEHEERYLASDAVFTDMSSGQEWTGREAVAGMLHWFYEVAFDATFEHRSLVVDEEHGMLEGTVVGRHIGEFAGVPVLPAATSARPSVSPTTSATARSRAAASISPSRPSWPRWVPPPRRPPELSTRASSRGA
jgi:hypothetical protein